MKFLICLLLLVIFGLSSSDYVFETVGDWRTSLLDRANALNSTYFTKLPEIGQIDLDALLLHVPHLGGPWSIHDEEVKLRDICRTLQSLGNSVQFTRCCASTGLLDKFGIGEEESADIAVECCDPVFSPIS